MALDEQLFERKMQALYYGIKPKSDDRPSLVKKLENSAKKIRTTVPKLPKTIRNYNYKSLINKAKANKPLTIGLGLGMVSVLTIGAVILSRPHKPKAETKVLGVQNGSGSAAAQGESKLPKNQDPSFAVLLPEGKTAADVGGFTKISPNNGGAPAYTFVDKIGSIEVQVTQQQLPDSFKVNPSSEVEKLAIGFNATQSVKTTKREFFIGTSAQGPQSVITYTKDLLIFIKSGGKVTNEAWQRYIEDLQ